MCQEKYFVYTLRLLAGKFGAICLTQKVPIFKWKKVWIVGTCSLNLTSASREKTFVN